MTTQDTREPIHWAASRIYELLKDGPSGIDVGEALGLVTLICWLTLPKTEETKQ